MLAIDLVVGLLIVGAALAGARLGLARALPIVGAAAGVLLGSRVPLLVGEELDSNYALNVAVPAALVLGGIGAALGETFGGRAFAMVRRSLVLDAGVGAILTGAAAAVVVWALAPPVRPARDKRQPAPDLPRTARRSTPTAVRDPRLRARPDVKRAVRNVVKILTNRCGGGYQGTGWIAGHGIVVTNAHVVSAAEQVTVSRQGKGRALAANVIWFDGIHDLALLRVGALRREAGLPLAADPQPGTPGASFGFPRGKLTIRHARVGPTTADVRLPQIDLDSRAGISLTLKDRLVTIIRGLSGDGASGGPVVDRHGQVVATVFAGITQTDITLAVPNRIVRSALRRANHRAEVPSCDTPPLKPTREHSIAARDA